MKDKITPIKKIWLVWPRRSIAVKGVPNYALVKFVWLCTFEGGRNFYLIKV